MTYFVTQINGRYYVQHIAGGRCLATVAEVQLWERLQAEIRQKEELLAQFEVLQAELIVTQHILCQLDRILEGRKS